MNHTINRYVVAPLISAGVMGAALGLAGVASAVQGTSNSTPGVMAAPQVQAKPAPETQPGYLWHKHHTTLLDPRTAANLPHVG